jgi:hypothetical protein
MGFPSGGLPVTCDFFYYLNDEVVCAVVHAAAFLAGFRQREDDCIFAYDVFYS